MREMTMPLLSLAIIGLTSLPAAAQDHNPRNSGAPTVPSIGSGMKFAAAGIEVDTPSYNFGRMMAGAEVFHDYWFTNTGSEMLEIVDIKTSCGCTRAGPYDRQIPPGESGRIPIMVKTKGKRGQFQQQVTVTTNVTESRVVSLIIKGELWEPVTLTPPHLSFGRLGGDELKNPITRDVLITSNLDTPFEILNVESAKANIFRVESIKIDEGKNYKLRVTMLPPFPEGPLNSNIKITTNLAEAPELTVIASAYIPQPVQVLPPSIQVAASTDQPLTRFVLIRNNTGQTMSISNVKCSDENIKVDVSQQAANYSYRLSVTVPANYTVKPDTTITLNTDMESANALSIPIIAARATGIGPAANSNPARRNIEGVGPAGAASN